MTDIMLELNFEITAYVYELHELQGVIKELDKALIKESTPENLLYMNEIGDRYMKLCDRLRITLESYFAEEVKEGLPTEFSYRKLYKQITA